MFEFSISGSTVMGATLWFFGITSVALSFVGPVQLAAIGLLLAGAGGVVQIRGFLCRLESRERNAFAVGRDYEAGVRSLR